MWVAIITWVVAMNALLYGWYRFANWRRRRELAARHISPREVLKMYNQAMLREKLQDEALMRGSSYPRSAVEAFDLGRKLAALEQYCEHCPVWGHCSICGKDHPQGAAWEGRSPV